MLGAMRAAIHHAARFNAMADNAALAMAAFRGERVNGALEAVEVMGNSIYEDFERLVVFVAANFACMKSGVEAVFRIAG